MSEIYRFNGSQAEFDINEIGERSKTTFMGTFKVKCVLSPLDMLKMVRLYRDLIVTTNPHLASQTIENIAFALSQLKFRVVESPEFWKNTEIDGGHVDQNVVIEIINLAINAEEEFNKREDERVKQLQERLTRAIKNKEIEKEPELDEIKDEYVEIDSEEYEEVDPEQGIK